MATQGVSRITPLEDAELDENARTILDMVRPTGADAGSVFRTLVRHPKLLRDFVRYGGRLMYGEIGQRDRELVILRVAVRTQSAYEWGQHVLVARQMGIDDADITAVSHGPSATRWNTDDRALLQAVDQLIDDSQIDDPTWAALRATRDDLQLIELPLLVGHFIGVAYLLNAIRVVPDTPLPQMPSPIHTGAHSNRTLG
jgi:alkylhydroperoxidase family enzyme